MDSNASTSDKGDALSTWMVDFDRVVQLALPSTQLTVSPTDGSRVANDPNASFLTAIIVQDDDKTGLPVL